ncbi:MAG: hypothetical protein IJN55_03615 [Alistipes sp.]|nr:hypothetical protein [Alistipes sp.]
MAIIMIATEIIMMLNELCDSPEFISGLISGGLSGVVVSLCWWLVTTRLLAPHLKISPDIAYEIINETREKKDSYGRVVKDANGKAIMIPYKAIVYRIKVANVSIRKAFDIRIFFRLRYENHYATIELPYQPYLMSRKNRLARWIDRCKGVKETYEHHRTIPFRLTDIRISKIEGYKNPDLMQRHTDGVLCLNDFKKDDTIVEFVMMAVDSISGSALRVLAKKFSQKDLDEHVKEGRFLDGEMVIRSNIQTSDG